jgi:hypothetical protein
MWMSMAKQIARMLQTPSFWRQRGKNGRIGD